MASNTAWPVIAGTFEVGDPQAPVAVCSLTSEHLIAPLVRLRGVAIAGKVYTANLGIERIVVNVTANPAIRFLLICGKDSPLFRPGQSLAALAEAGLDAERRIVGAVGYEPILSALVAERVAQFRRQIEVLDWTGEEDLGTLERRIESLVARTPGRLAVADAAANLPSFAERFTVLRPGGQREPLQYDPKGYFVISLDREAGEIVLRHYLTDHTPAHQMRGRTAGPMLLGLLREGLVTQLSHAGYLGEELTKAQVALQFGLRYDQDRSLRPREVPAAPAAPDPAARPEDAPQPVEQSPTSPSPAMRSASPVSASAPTPAGMPSISPPTTWAELQAAALGTPVNVVLAITDVPAPDLLGGDFLAPDEAEPFSVLRRTPHRLQLRWTTSTQLAMGTADDLGVGALVRARGTLAAGAVVAAERLAILTRVARIVEGDGAGGGAQEGAQG